MKLFALSYQAKNDLLEIGVFTAQTWGKVQRNYYLKQLDDTFHLLAKKPALGVACDEIKMGYRKFPQGSHLIFYKENPSKDILIVRMLHKRMDYSANTISNNSR
jgi:toxin ParE1/3/4